MAHFSSIGVIQVSVSNIQNKFKTVKGMAKNIEKRFEQNNEDFLSEDAPFLVEPFLDTFGELSVRITSQNGKVCHLEINSL